MTPETSVDPSHARMLELTMVGYLTSEVIGTAAQLGVADELTHGPRHVDEIARAVGADAPSLYRLLRVLADAGLVEEHGGQCFASTELGELLRSDVPGSMRDWAAVIGVPWHRDMWADLAATIRTGEPAFERVHGQPPWDYLRQHPDTAAMFDRWMTTLSSHFIAPAVLAYDFSPLTTVVDVGGGRGALLAAVLTAYPHMHGTLFDRPEVVAAAAPLLDDAGVAGRCTRAGGDFFESVPIGGDAYLLSNIIHDWPDEPAVQILANCRAAMNDTGRMLLAETVIPDTREPALAKLIDIEVLLMLGGRERTPSQLGELLQRARLRVSQVLQGDLYSVVEAVPA